MRAMRRRSRRLCARRRRRSGLRPTVIEPIGYLDVYMTTLGFRIVPVLARVAPGFTLTLNPGEVDNAFEVPLAFLMETANHQTHSREWQGMMRHLLCDPVRRALYLGRDRRHFPQSVSEDLRRMIRPVLTEIVLFVTPFAAYALFLVATRAGVLHPDSWRWRVLVSLTGVALVLMIGGFVDAARSIHAHPAGSNYVPPHVEGRQSRSRTVQMTLPTSLAGAAWLTGGAGGAPVRGARLRRRGSARGRRRGARCADRRAGRTRSISPRPPCRRKSCAAPSRRRIQAACRPGSTTAR